MGLTERELCSNGAPDSDLQPTQTPWFALTVKPQHERAVEQGLLSKGLEAYLPLYETVRRWSDRSKTVRLPLFTGYVFCRLDRVSRTSALRVPGARSLVCFGSEPAPIPHTEIDHVRKMLRSGYPVSPWPFLRVGDRVYVSSGPLAGLDGILLRFANRCCVVVSMELLQRSVAVVVPREYVMPMPQPATSLELRVQRACV